MILKAFVHILYTFSLFKRRQKTILDISVETEPRASGRTFPLAAADGHLRAGISLGHFVHFHSPFILQHF